MDAAPLIETTSGRLRGVREGDLCVFRGVRYAEAPVGPLRFRPPQLPRPWADVHEARAFGPVAPQRVGPLAAALGAKDLPQSEDCLRLNVWTPGLDAARRPVLVWLHGGGFTSGSSSEPLYDGAALARRGDAVVVTVSYRLGILGWLALPAFAEEDGGSLGNLGLRDQLAALAWVRDHAVLLGGDPDNVLLFGESAGAMSVGTLLGCPAARGLFRRAILQSGACHNAHDPERAAAVAAAAIGALGVGAEDREALRALPVEAVLKAQDQVLATSIPGVRQPPFQPVIDGELVPRLPIDAVRRGQAAGVDVVVGTNREEYRLWSLTDPKAAFLDREALLRRCRRNVPQPADSDADVAERVVAHYTEVRQARGEPIDPPSLWYAIETDRIFRIPALRLLQAQAEHARTWSYLFTWPSPALGGGLAACHGLEMPFVFGRLGDARVQTLTGGGPVAQALATVLQGAWLAFARAGDPATRAAEWPPYTDATRATRIFGAGGAVALAPGRAEESVWEGVL